VVIVVNGVLIASITTVLSNIVSMFMKTVGNKEKNIIQHAKKVQVIG
jgi:hypothetical protein